MRSLSILCALAWVLLVATPGWAGPVQLTVIPNTELNLATGDGLSRSFLGKERTEQALEGTESSQCENYGRKSASSGTASVDIVTQEERRISLQLRASSLANGGHYRRCGGCAFGQCVGIFPRDTSASSRATASAKVKIYFAEGYSTEPYFLKIASQVEGSGREMKIRITDENGGVVSMSQEGREWPLIEGKPGSHYFVDVDLSSAAENGGACCSSKDAAAAMVSVSLQKAPLLYGINQFQPYIAGGKETKSYKNVAVILLDGLPHCTATLISSKTLVTAAHCIHGYFDADAIKEQRVRVAFGSVYSQPTEGPFVLEGYAYPESLQDGYQFNPRTLEDDIAVLYLSTSPDKAKPAQLHKGVPTWESIVDDARSLIFVGFGYNVLEGEKVGLGIKREAAWSVGPLENRRVLFQVPGKNTCRGDSGGPAFLDESGKLILVAVTSGGDDGCTTGFDSRIDAFLAWINPRIR